MSDIFNKQMMGRRYNDNDGFDYSYGRYKFGSKRRTKNPHRIDKRRHRRLSLKLAIEDNFEE